MYGPAQILSGMLPAQSDMLPSDMLLSDMLPGPAEGSSSGAGLGAGQGQVDQRSARQSKSTGEPERHHEGPRTGIEASGGDGVEEGAEVENSEEETGPEKNFEDKLQELKEYKRKHGHACPPAVRPTLDLGKWLSKMRSCYKRGLLAAGKVTALSAVGVEFDGQKARAIREQHEASASGKGKAAEENIDRQGGGEGPSRKEQGARGGLDTSEEDAGAEAGEGARGSEMERRRKSFEARLQELKEYKRQHGEGVHVVLRAGCCSLGSDEGAPALIAT
jgi:hypothetical protein